MLSDAAGFARSHFGRANRIEQTGLAVIDVTHHRDDRCARHFDVIFDVAADDLFDLLFGDHLLKFNEGHVEAEAPA